MHTEIIDLNMGNQIESIRKKNGGIASPFSFVSLYAWKSIVGDEIHLEDNLYSLKYKNGNSNSWVFPCGGEKEKENFISELLMDEEATLFYVRDEDRNFLMEKFPDRFTIVRQDDFDEYIYSVKEQIEIKGDRFHRIRNRINKLLKEHALKTELLSDDNISDAIQVVKNWAVDKFEVGNLDTRGDEIDAKALSAWKELGISGVVIYSDNGPVAVAAGFYLSEDMYDVLLCKAYDRVPGLFLHTRRELICTLEKNCTWIDLEDDMGLQGLRTMKEELHPTGKIKMWRAMAK